MKNNIIVVCFLPSIHPLVVTGKASSIVTKEGKSKYNLAAAELKKW